MKVVIIGGHLTPALAVIEELSKDAGILYIGRKHAIEGDKSVSLEYSTITSKNIPFVDLKTGRLQRAVSRHILTSLSKIPVGFVQSLLALKKFGPDVVVGFGGYISFPVILAAKTLKIPVVIHEQTLEIGFANKLVSRFADKICISFNSSKKFFPEEKVILTGNPVRSTVIKPTKKINIERNGPLIFITGGSLGSHFINQLVENSLTKLVDKYTIVHQVGDARDFKDFEKLSILKEGLNNNKRGRYVISKFLSPEEIGSILKMADLVVSRAGINTISELILLEKPALLIPIPFSQKNEQLKNAVFFKELGLGEIEEQKNLTAEEFSEKINDMMENIQKYKILESIDVLPKNAAKKIVEVIYAAKKERN